MAERRGAGLTLILAATAVAGLGGYAITTIAARGLGPRDYAIFAVFWAALYLVVGTLSGFQQEMARAAYPAERTDTRPLLTLIAAVATAAVVVLAVVLGIYRDELFPREGWMLALPLLVGPVVNVSVAGITGVLYGISAWRILAVVIVGDVMLRLIGILTVLLLHGGVVAVAWVAVAPFGVVAVGLLLVVRPGGPARFALDSRHSRLAINIVRTIGGAIGISVMVSGFPLFIQLFSGSTPQESVGVLIFGLMLTRAPLVVSVLALQSYLVVFLRDRAGGLAGPLVRLFAALLAAAVVLAVIALAVGSPVVELLAGRAFSIAPVDLAFLVFVSAATGALAVTGAAVLARGLHGAYVAGWTIAAVLSVAGLALPGVLTTRVIVALAAGPLVGVVVHLLALRAGRRVSVGSSRAGAESPGPGR